MCAGGALRRGMQASMQTGGFTASSPMMVLPLRSSGGCKNRDAEQGEAWVNGQGACASDHVRCTGPSVVTSGSQARSHTHLVPVLRTARITVEADCASRPLVGSSMNTTLWRSQTDTQIVPLHSHDKRSRSVKGNACSCAQAGICIPPRTSGRCALPRNFCSCRG